ncbi:MOSC domain-containing protein [Paenibacillus rhizovicinus]|uniref:MOSC domain-containing protein n=1 Tax=Paenibacillus rhizovicinus TaxID=2704463 RepID=UPI001CDC12AF|nr:MOSC N-terminal beta barrel domain-containing protein [Paenibacillus rhizovicinus]
MQDTVKKIQIGQINAINRYPIKSLAGESLTSCAIEPYGLLGDRWGAFYDETKEGWSRFVTARNIPAMMSYQAKFMDGDIRVTSPDGREFGWDGQLLGDIQQLTETPIAMSRLKEPNPEDPRLMSVDAASILLVTDASLRQLEAQWGKDVDQRRFRGNFVVTLNADAPLEPEWIGSRLTIGDVRLQVDSLCERCVMITMDPDTLDKEPSLLKKVHQEFNTCLGAYASVISTGQIKIGDKVILESSATIAGQDN